jgi:hypothetical protein
LVKQNIYGWVHDTVTGQQVGGTPVGTWTAYAAPYPQSTPAMGSLSPPNGSGAGQVFTVSASSAHGYQYLTWLSILIEN